ncbi:hypothetical protein [Pseudonocardia hydrocarbonoxydans]|uniref:Phasin domain-containing protein n=1 Tax=Pseudonocardia hydrocarbonoxydans TaxID=76726 RepID=A0A4Y3WRB2_9PSEU|nr:hypothetical protein [Pseudonocardia hydrocarbonoxydans]GEC21324.1 hypothetical protein PHY01_36070 [Pseudonocardia hydrocarbonoxydans]
MNAPTDEFVRIAEQSRKAVTAAVHAWGETLQNAAGSLAFPAPLPGRDQTLAVVDSWFDVAAQVLAEQRAATTALVTRTHEAAATVSEQAGAMAATVTEKVAAATEAASETPSKARTPRNGATRPA